MKLSIILMYAFLALAVHAYDEYEEYSDSWDLGQPDNLVKTVVVVDPYGDCGCPK